MQGGISLFDFIKCCKILIIIPVTLLLSANRFITGIVDISVGELLLGNVLGRMSLGDTKAFVIIIEHIYYFVIFNILFGTYIYQDFQYSSIYLFSRLKNRKLWFYKKTCELLILSFTYAFLFVITNLVICLKISTNALDNEAIKIFIILCFKIFILLFITTLAINIIAIRFGSTYGFTSVYIVTVLLIFLAINHNKLPLIGDYQWSFMLNPFSGFLSKLISHKPMQVGFYLYNTGLIAIIIIFSAIYIDNFDIALADHEVN